MAGASALAEEGHQTQMKTLSLVIALVVCTCACAWGNPILLAPSGNTLSTGQVRAEAAFSTDSGNGRYFWLGTGLLQVEANVIRLDDVKGQTENRVNVQWNFLPETFATPAVAFGATDVASESEKGIGGYLVVTKHLKIPQAIPLVRDFAGTAGIGVAGIRGPFVGFQSRLVQGFFVEAEYDSLNFNAAVGWQPIKMLRLKAYTLQNEFYLGAEIPPISF